jgi:membrane-bound serine protease (ClpP class)
VARHLARAFFAASAALGLLGMLSGTIVAVGTPRVSVLPATGIVDNVLAGYLAEGIGRAARDGDAAVVIRLNTPGGDLSATNDIVGTLLDADVPVIVWVAPSGGRAASAGTFITLAANIALMAPGTNIGAASPVGSGGEDITGTLGDKVRNDAIAKIKSIAVERGRNVDWAVSAVDKAVSSPATEAVQQHVVDGIAASLDEVIAFANGKQVKVGGETRTLDLSGATTRDLAMNPFQAFLHLLSDPNIAALLFSVGSLGLLYELMNPNFVTGIIGALAIILAFVGFGSLPLNVAGLLLIVLGVVLFALEVTVTSHGLLGVGGVICYALGASALYTAPVDPFEPIVRVAPEFIVVMTVTAGAFVALIAYAAIRTRALPAGPGVPSASLVPGTPAVVRRPLQPVGSVYAAGEEWTARTIGSTPLERGTPVRIVKVEGLTLFVEPVDTSTAA